ncbi:hypothetical protein FRB90_005186 [Tulasnella sp. 427]|nr:hypothetical protein FRB90_005186 [Tulasnella sp. 427]
MTLIPFLPNDRFGVCLPTSPGHEIFGFFLSSLVFDSLVTIMMVYRVFQLKGETQDRTFSRSPLVQLFVSEGLWYFLLVSIANLVNGLMFAQKEKSLQATAVPFSNMLPPILACRLILDLREHGGSTDGNSWLTTGRGNVGFILPAFLYRSTPAPTAPLISTIRFQSPPQGHSSASTSQGGSGTDSTVSYREAVGQKASLVRGLTSIKDGVEEVEDGDEIVDVRDVLVSPGKVVEEEEDVTVGAPGLGSQYYVAYRMGPVITKSQTASKASEGGM